MGIERKRRSYDKLTNDYAKWLFPHIDRYDWGYFHPHEGHPVYAAPNERMNKFYRRDVFPRGETYPPRKLTRTHLQGHLRGTDKLYYLSNRSSGFVFPMIDIDAHRGEDDAFETTDFLLATCFPGAYYEPSRRGYHIHPLIRVGRITRRVFNVLLHELENSLATLALSEGFASQVELKAQFTLLNAEREIEPRGSLGTIPFLRGDHRDLDRLQRAPIFLPAAIYEINRRAQEFQKIESELEDSTDSSPDVYVSPGRWLPRRMSNCAWERMQWACFDFTTIYRRLPSFEELLAYYKRVYDTDDGTKARRIRARDAIRYRKKTFDPSKATDRGYWFYRDQLLDAVKTHCLDRTHKCHTRITDEDLAIALYVVMLNSFGIQTNPRRQWTCPYECFVGMFEALKRVGVTKRGAGKRNKVAAVKQILERAALIECIDRKCVSRGVLPVGQKYHIGMNHWRYGEFIKFADTIDVEYVGQKMQTRRTVFPEPVLM